MKTASLSKDHIVNSFKTLPDRLKTSFRDSRVWGFFLSMAIMAVVSVAFFMPDNFEGHTLQQHDQIQGAANGHEGQVWEAETGEKALWTNSLFSGMPTFQISPSYPSNSLFTWLGSVYGLGLPAPSNLLFMMMFGFLIMMACLKQRWWYGLIGALAWGLSSYFIIIIGAGHIWKFFALTYVPPTIGGLIMIYRGRRLAGTAILALFAMLELNANHPQISYYFAFLMAFLVIAFLVTDGMKGRIKSWLASTGLVLVAGALAVGANLPSLYNTYEYSKETKRAASELTPLKTDDKADAAAAERPTGGLPKSEIGGWSNLPEESFSLLIPNIKGGATIKPEGGQNKLLALDMVDDLNPEYLDAQPSYQVGPGQTETIPILSQMPQYFGGKGLTNGPFYVGALIVALFILGCFIVPGALKWVLLVSTVFSVMLAMGNHFEALTDFMIYNVPLYNKFRAAETALVIACLCMPLLAMLALRRLMTMDSPMKDSNVRLGLTFGFTLPILVCLLAYFKPEIFGPAITTDETAQLTGLVKQFKDYGLDISDQVEATMKNIQVIRYDIVSADAGRSFVILLLGGGVLVLACLGRLRRGVAVAAIGVITVVDLYSVDKRYIDSDSFTSTLTASDPLAPDAVDTKIMKDKDYYRVMDYNEFGGARRSYYHHMVGGYHAAKLNRYNDLIERSNGFISDGQPNRNLLSMLNTRYIIFPARDEKGNPTVDYEENPYNLGPAWLVDSLIEVENADEEMAALLELDPSRTAVYDKRFADALEGEMKGLTAGDTIKLDEYTPNRLTYTVDTRDGGVAVFSEVWFPWGWTATIDGQEAPLARVNYVLRALRVPAGKHTVVMTFNPESLHVTGNIAYGSVTIIYLLCAAALFLVVIGFESAKKKDEKPA